ncbi:LuxR C-terminal-related transcriptional regulator [Nocardioides taihuensis]|uniref:LuxR C-terminal-related transcriptional regulator n=1 Tax=Nocardioides taihuensis TaxID=1835606 RepID=A0ABW0BDX4_9ACTN
MDANLPLVESKLFRPRTRPDVVRRARLARPAAAARTRLTLVAAPAGFGKTTLLTSWYGEDQGADDPRVAWVSLDEGDRQAGSFWAYLLTAVERAAPGTAAAGLTLLQSGQAPVESVLTGVLNELSVLPDDLEVVLDDYHLADGPEVQPGMAFLVDHLPPQVRLTLGTRADPALPLARLRARGELTEVRATDLRFTTEETGAYLVASGVDLAGDDLASLADRTEGWIAALHLAAISLTGREDRTSFIAGFAGDDRYVVDYLVEEVLDRQPAEVRDFLLGTSVLERLTGPLCDTVTGTSGSRRLLERLERENLFVVPLDDHRRWYRYHHLFADVLGAHLQAEHPDRVTALHRRASQWYDEQGDAAAAVRHALAAGDDERAADLVERAVPGLQRERREAVIVGWVEALPPDVTDRRPLLALGLAGGLMSSNRPEGVAQRLDEVDRMLHLPADELVVADREALAGVPATVRMYRAALALLGGDLAGTTRHATAAAELAAGRGDTLVAAGASALLGLAAWTRGDLAGALRDYRAAAAGLREIGHVADVLGCSIAVADLQVALGGLHDARATLEDALVLGATVAPDLRGTADMHDGLAGLALERGDLAAAAEHLRRSDELGEVAGLPQHPYRWRAAMAGLREAEGDRGAAVELLEEAQRVHVGDFSPDVRPLASRLARVRLALGDLDAARAWARRRNLSADDAPSYLREHEHLTLARLLVADGELAGAESLLERLLADAETGGRVRAQIEALVLLSGVRRDRGDRPGAVTALERARLLAEREGFVRVLTDGATTTPAASVPVPQVLVDPLSERELEVLRLLASELDGPAIARELVVSLHTVRTHTKHIYAKLGVNSRRAAVTRAHQLGLLRHPR